MGGRYPAREHTPDYPAHSSFSLSGVLCSNTKQQPTDTERNVERMKIQQLDLQNLDTLDLDKQPFLFDAVPIADNLQTIEAQPLDLHPTELDVKPLAVDVQPLEVVQCAADGALISARPAMAAGQTAQRKDRNRNQKTN